MRQTSPGDLAISWEAARASFGSESTGIIIRSPDNLKFSPSNGNRMFHCDAETC